MMSERDRPIESLSLRFFGDGVDDVDAPTLAAALDGLQRAVYLTALYTEGRDVPPRGQYPADLISRYTLRCQRPVQGSYAIPMHFPAPDDIHDPESVPKTVDNLTSFVDAVSRGDRKRAESLIKKPVFLSRLLKAIGALAPRQGNNYRVGLGSAGRTEVVLSEVAGRHIREMAHVDIDEPSKLTVTGELEKIDFKRRIVTLIYPVTSKQLDCAYPPDIEDSLLEARHGYIQVSGTVILDDDGEPKEIVDVFDIRNLDDSEILLSQVSCGDFLLRLHQPLRLLPQLTESRQLMYIEQDDLGIDVYGITREALLEDLYEQIALIWKEYVEIPPGELTGKAAALGENWREIAEKAAAIEA